MALSRAKTFARPKKTPALQATWDITGSNFNYLSKGWFPLSRNLYVRTCVKFTFANKIEARYEGSHVSVKVETRSTSRLAQHLISCLYFYLLSRTLLAALHVHDRNPISSFSGTGRSTNSIAWKRWLLWNKWLLQWSKKTIILMSKTSRFTGK